MKRVFLVPSGGAHVPYENYPGVPKYSTFLTSLSLVPRMNLGQKTCVMLKEYPIYKPIQIDVLVGYGPEICIA